jgi:Calcineurin-like phosphoesterase
MIRSTTAAMLVALSACAVAQPVPPMPARGSFALIGDVPYGAATEPQFDRVIDAINAQPRVRFVLHTGDIKAGSERCDDDLLQRRFDQYQRFDKPFVFTPGDNEWTDCHRTNNGNYLPTERLGKLRSLFFAQPGVTTGGRPARVATQSSIAGFETFVENTMWSFGGATMATVHVVGSNNGYAPWNQIDPSDSYETPRADRVAEVDARIAAAVAWIDVLFDRAALDRSAGVLVAMQANPNFELPASDLQRLGFNAVLDRITARAIAFGKPVVIAHGDSHYHRVDKPLLAPTPANGLQLLERVTRAENFGSQHVHWLEVSVDARDPEVFRFQPHLIEANLFPR